ncbi:MAG: 2-oxo-4-hydroxy-4-carboxy-5-ureidoimidazoline decarboxylase [Acidobacteria bacterium]|nr:2-oxo-4-hydroxy-4-carboxy-5-ureidoimidazoline decarboxylase [Acidobacteriota bacterium]
MTGDVERLNALTPEEAEASLLKCCGSAKWAARVAASRPFEDMHELLLTADHVWWALDSPDWLEAFAAHPKIGEKKAADSSASANWAAEEQRGATGASGDTLQELAQANHDYERRFGYIFIVCATGKSADEMLALLKERLHHEPDTELRIAAEEQRRITHLRLEKLLSP